MEEYLHKIEARLEYRDPEQGKQKEYWYKFVTCLYPVTAPCHIVYGKVEIIAHTVTYDLKHPTRPVFISGYMCIDSHLEGVEYTEECRKRLSREGFNFDRREGN